MQDLQRADSLAALLQGSVGQLSFLAAPGAAGQGNDPALPFLGGRPELLPSGSDGSAGVDAHSSGWLRPEAEMEDVQESGRPDGEREVTGTATAGSGGSKGGQRRRRSRSDKQQELNRLAQQRYRERKKAKYQNLQGTVEALNSQVEAMKALQQENAGLSGRTQALQQRVAEQEAAMAQLQASSMESQARAAAAMARVAEQERMLADASALIRQQAAALKDAEVELRTLKAKMATGNCTTECVDARMLEPTIRAVMREVLATVNTTTAAAAAQQQQQAAAASCAALPATIPDSLVAQICRCCRQMDAQEGAAAAKCGTGGGGKELAVSCC